MFSQFFIKRPIFATVIAILMVIAGIMTVRTLPVAQLPDITPPTVMVSASYPGADASTLAQTVATPIEKQVNGVEGMLYMSSTCNAGGDYSLTITFENGTDIDQAAVNIQNRISQIESTLPTQVTQQGLSVTKQSSNYILFVAIEADSTVADKYDALYLTNYAQIHLTEPLSRVKGVGGVGAFGGGEYDMRVWLKPDVMKVRGITPTEVTEAIEAQNMHVSAGSVGKQPGAGDIPFEYTLTANGTLTTPEEFGNIILRSGSDGILRLKDIADIEMGSNSYSQIARVNGKQTALLGISQLPGANAINVADASLKELDRLSQYFPDGIKYNVILNSTDFVHDSIDEVLVTFVETTLIVLIVILLFLQNWRAVIIPMLTIPVSLIATFAVMKILGFTLNTLTLFGLVLAIAIVVDDAIVVVEDCARLVSEGKLNRIQAAEKAMKELTGPVVGEVLVLLSVFIPTAFVSGITGSLYKQFALTIAVSTAFSGFNALTLTPALCALFLNPKKPTKNPIYKGFNKVYDYVSSRYSAAILSMLKHAKVWIIVFLILIGAGIYVYTKYPSSYLPEEDMGYCIASIELPTGASLNRTEKVVSQLAEEFRKQVPAIKDVMAISGVSFMGGGNGSNGGSMFIILKPIKDRPGKESVEKVIEQLNIIAATTQQEAIFFALNPPSIPGLGLTSGLQLQLLDINNLGPSEIAKAMDNLTEALKKTGKFESVTTLYQAGVPQYTINVDRDKATMRHLDPAEIFNTLSAFTGGGYSGDFTRFGQTYQVTTQATGASRNDIGDLHEISVRNTDGEMVPLDAFATITPSMGPASISRYNMYTTASLTATPAKGVASSTAITEVEETLNKALGENFSYAWSGIAYQQTQAGTTISFVFIFAIVMTILVLAAQYENWTDPLAVVLAMPVGVLGCLLGCFLMGLDVDIYTQIGVILLLGMGAKNAILIVEYARDFRNIGQTRLKSAHDAGIIRFRPIMMTALAFIFGVMPMLFATGAGAGSRREIGTAIVFGMSMNAIIGTLFVPLFWYITDNLQERYLSRVFKKPPQPTTVDTQTSTDKTLPPSI